MGDGAPAITKAGEEVFADCDQCEDSLRLMCWSHVPRAVNKSSNFEHLRSEDKKLWAKVWKIFRLKKKKMKNEKTLSKMA